MTIEHNTPNTTTSSETSSTEYVVTLPPAHLYAYDWIEFEYAPADGKVVVVKRIHFYRNDESALSPGDHELSANEDTTEGWRQTVLSDGSVSTASSTDPDGLFKSVTPGGEIIFYMENNLSAGDGESVLGANVWLEEVDAP